MEHPSTPDRLKEPLEEWVSEEVRRRWNEQVTQLDNGMFRAGDALIPNSIYDSDFPDRIIPLVLDVVATQSDANVAIGVIFSKVFTEEKGTLGGYHSHSTVAGTTQYIRTEAAISLAENSERLYGQLCEGMTPDIETTEKMVSKLFGPEIASRITNPLVAIHLGHFYSPLQKKAIQIIKEQGIERFETLCSETVRILNEGGHWAEVVHRTPDHHGMGWEVDNEYQYRPESLEAAEQYLRDQGIFEQEKTERYSYTISCDDEGNEGLIDHLNPEYSIRWDKEKEQWVYQWTIRHHARWDPERPLSESPTAYGYMLKHFGLDNLSEPLPIERGYKTSPTDLQQLTKPK